MRFLIDANLPRSLADRLRIDGHVVDDCRDLGLATAGDDEIARRSRDDQSVLVTRDFDFADVRNYPPAQYPGIIVVDFPSETSAEVMVAMVGAAIADVVVLHRIPGMLAIIEPGRVRLRESK